MCGITGFIDNKKRVNVLSSMTEVLNHRGPDDSGIDILESKFSQYIHFGHKRLSVLDLSKHGHQPFISDCGQYIVVYNGEVYNFKDIQAELYSLGYTFISNSDTEVILYAYKEWGIKCLEKFIGMFAFSIFDKVRQKVILVRDRAGVKPLYYYAFNGVFLFSSEIKSFHQHLDFKKELNKDVLGYYMQFGYIPAPYSIFENCYKLKPGHYLEYDLKSNAYEIYKYWDVIDFYKKDKIVLSEKEIISDIEELLLDAFQLRMVSDVPVGVFLSGGYDSSLVTAVLQKNNSSQLNTFTIGFDEKGYNEAKHARKIAEYLGTNHTEYYCSKNDMLDIVEELPFFYDEPFGDSSSIPTILVSRLAKKNVTVALSADGGDEAFCGYSKYFALNRVSSLLSNNTTKTCLRLLLKTISENSVDRINEYLPKSIKQTNIRDKFQKFKRAVDTDSEKNMFKNASSCIHPADINKLLSGFSNSDLQDIAFNDFDELNSCKFIDKMMAVDYKSFMVDDVLTKVDRATMSVSLEGREPLLDHRIIEYMARVPVAMKYKNGQAKYLLRQILYNYLPQKLVDKPKSGFQIPLFEWLKTDLRYLIDKYLDKDRLNSDGIFNGNEVGKVVNDYLAGKYVNINQLWFIINFEMWKEKWM